jgi:hypothetical protein
VNPIETQKYLKGVDYPADRQTLVEAARGNGAPDEIVEALSSMDSDSFDGPSAVMSGMSDADVLPSGDA